MPDRLIKTQETIRHIHRGTNQPTVVPLVTVNQGIDIYKGEIIVNSSSSNPCLYLRAGNTEEELPTDKLIRIGNVIIDDDDPRSLYANLNYDGLYWYNTANESLNLHLPTGGWKRISTVNATVELEGVLKLSTTLEAITGNDNSKAVTPLVLNEWRNYYGLVSRRDNTFTIYVDKLYGDDSIENDGSDPYSPFYSIERAAIEVARRSYNYPNLPHYKKHTVFVAPGDYNINNQQGAAKVETLQPANRSSRGPINPALVEAKVKAVDFTKNTVTLTARIDLDEQQIWSVRAGKVVGSAVLNKGVIFSDTLSVRNFKGSWLPGDSIQIAQTYLFNSVTGGFILPRGCSLIGLDPDKTVLRPKYISSIDLPNTAILKLTNGTYVSGLVFADSGIFSSHHRCSAVEYVNKEDLNNRDYGYYLKVFSVFKDTIDPAMEKSYIEVLPSELSNNDLGYAILVSDAIVKSYYGMTGFIFEYGGVDGNNEVLLSRVVVYTEQADSNAYTDTDSNKLKRDWRNSAVKAAGKVIVKSDNLQIKGVAVAFTSLDGGEQFISGGSCTGVDTLFEASGYAKTELIKDDGGLVQYLIPPYPTPTQVKKVPLGSLNKSVTNTNTRIYLDQFLNTAPYSPFLNDNVYVQAGVNEYKAKFVRTGVDYVAGAYVEYIELLAEGNEIFANLGNIPNLASVYLKRVDDRRTHDTKLYWFVVNKIAASIPKPNTIMRSSKNEDYLKTYRCVEVIKLANDSYKVALALGSSIDPDVIRMVPDPNQEEFDTATDNKEATRWLLTELGYSSADIDILLQESFNPTELITQINVQFEKASYIQSKNLTLDAEYDTQTSFGGVVKLG